MKERDPSCERERYVSCEIVQFRVFNTKLFGVFV